MRVVLYIRVSTREQVEKGYSIGEQEERLRAYCKAMGWSVVRMFCDPGFSGAKLDRPGLRGLLEDVRHGQCDAVLVWKLDRLSRSQKDTLFLIEDEFLKNDVAFVSMNENFDTSTPFGRAMVGILSVFAQLEREQIRERMLMGREARAKNGLFNGGGFIPVGYEYKDGELVPNSYEAAQIKELFDLYVTKDWSRNQIHRHFLAAGYTTHCGTWNSYSSIKRALKCPIYAGDIQWMGETYEGQHEPLISREMFQAAQEKIARTNKQWIDIRDGEPVPPFVARHLLTGILYCPECGGKLAVLVKQSTGRYKGADAKSYTYRYYKCNGPKKGTKKAVGCKYPKIKLGRAEELVWAQLLRLQFDPDELQGLLEAGRDNADAALMAEKQAALMERISILEGNINRLLDLYTVGGSGLPVQAITDRLSEAQSELDRLQCEVDRMDDEGLISPSDYMEYDAIIREKFSTVSKVKETGSLEEQRTLVHSLIERVTIDPRDETMVIKWRFSAK